VDTLGGCVCADVFVSVCECVVTEKTPTFRATPQVEEHNKMSYLRIIVDSETLLGVLDSFNPLKRAEWKLFREEW